MTQCKKGTSLNFLKIKKQIPEIVWKITKLQLLLKKKVIIKNKAILEGDILIKLNTFESKLMETLWETTDVLN